MKQVIIQIMGDSGDGIQIIGDKLSNVSAMMGNDTRSFSDFPAEIRAPAGTLSGISGYRLCFSNQILTYVGDRADVLVAFNPAALKQGLLILKPQGIIWVDENKFGLRELQKAGFKENPLENGELSSFQVKKLPLTKLTLNAVKDCQIPHSKAKRCNNFFILGFLFWLYSKDSNSVTEWIDKKYGRMTNIAKANQYAFQAGYSVGDNLELQSEIRYEVPAAKMPAGEYIQVNGNQALVYACLSILAHTTRSLYVGGYPITPASDILHMLMQQNWQRLQVNQLEDETAAAGAALGAAYGGALAITFTSGPGFDLMQEVIGLGVMVELPLIIVNVQRSGPSTGMPTKTEQTDLLSAIYGRHGECPVPVLAANSPKDCFNILIEAFEVAVKYMTPVIVLSECLIANGSEPWCISTARIPNEYILNVKIDQYLGYERNFETKARYWVLPGDKDKEYRIGGLEKDYLTGNISYDAKNHQDMVMLRQSKIQNIMTKTLKYHHLGCQKGEVLLIGWGATFGVNQHILKNLLNQNLRIGLLQFCYLNPLDDISSIAKKYQNVFVLELNTGQLALLLKAQGINIQSIIQISGLPMCVDETVAKINRNIIQQEYKDV